MNFETLKENLGMARRRRRKKEKMSRDFDMRSRTSLDEPSELGFGSHRLDNPEILLGTYSVSEWIIASLKKKKFTDGANVLAMEDSWLAPTLNAQTWVSSMPGVKFIFESVRSVLIYEDSTLPAGDKNGLTNLSIKNGKIDGTFYGSEAWCDHWMKLLDSVAARAGAMIQWVYGAHGEEMSLPLNYRPAIKAAYPWINMDINDYIDGYLESDASVLVLIGPPGTGKTTFIKNLIHRAGRHAKVTYDERTMASDSFFANFMEDDAGFLVMEDADAFLQKRTDGNTMMHKFLNVSDGLISAVDKKLVFSTNLASVKDIDDALTRPGRCYDVAHARNLTRTEAMAVIQETGVGGLPEGKDSIPLAEIFSKQPTGGQKKRSMGFV